MEPTERQWAIKRRVEDVFAKLGEKYGDLTGRVELVFLPDVPFEHVGGLQAAKTVIQGFSVALTNPELYRRWGITPPKGVLLYGPPGTGKSLLAKALATIAGAIFYHLKCMNLTSKFGPNTGEIVQEIVGIAVQEGNAVVFLDEADALSLEHLLPPPQAREASARLVAALAERLDGIKDFSRVVVIAATNRTDAVDPTLVAPGRLDRLIEVSLPEPHAQQEIFEIHRSRAEAAAERRLFVELDYTSLLPPMGGLSGAEIAEVVRRALESKVHRAAAEGESGLVSTPDLLREIDSYRKIREVVEKIRYGQYL